MVAVPIELSQSSDVLFDYVCLAVSCSLMLLDVVDDSLCLAVLCDNFVSVLEEIWRVFVVDSKRYPVSVLLDDHIPPGSGEIDFAALKPFLKSDTIKVIELKPGIPALEVSEGIRFVQKRLLS